MKINPRGYWENDTQEGHGVDESIAEAVKIFLQQELIKLKKDKLSIIDIGCGDGFYTKYLNSNGLICKGFDGNPYTKIISNEFCSVADFSIKQNLGLYDWVLSLEVGEHIPEEYEDIFIDNLHRHNKYGMIISWSIPEHGGDGHFNPRTNDYIINKITKLGYILDKENTKKIRDRASNCWWFSKTLFVFRKDIENE